MTQVPIQILLHIFKTVLDLGLEVAKVVLAFTALCSWEVTLVHVHGRYFGWPRIVWLGMDITGQEIALWYFTLSRLRHCVGCSMLMKSMLLCLKILVPWLVVVWQD